MVLLHDVQGFWRNHKACHRWRSIKLLVDEDCDRCVDNATRICIHQVANMLWKVELCWKLDDWSCSISASHLMWIITPHISKIPPPTLSKLSAPTFFNYDICDWTRLSASSFKDVGTCYRFVYWRYVQAPLSVSSMLRYWTTAPTWYIWLLDICRQRHTKRMWSNCQSEKIRFIDVAWPNRALGWYQHLCSRPSKFPRKGAHTSEILSYASVVQLMGSETHLSQICHLDFSGANVKNNSLQRLLAHVCMPAA